VDVVSSCELSAEQVRDEIASLVPEGIQVTASYDVSNDDVLVCISYGGKAAHIRINCENLFLSLDAFTESMKETAAECVAQVMS
jgi:hypothetical protein